MTTDKFSTRATPLLHGREIDGCLLLFEYQDHFVRDAIWELKFHGNRKIASILATLLYDRLIEELAELKLFSGFDKPLAVPIPVSKKTLFSRGWNQCEILARELEKLDNGKNFEMRLDVLEKRSGASDQIGKSRKDRMKNLDGCFSVKNANIIKGRDIILLDDVVTTGTTIKEAKKTLKEAGVKKIFCVAIAH